MFGDDWDAELPQIDLLVVGCRDEPLAVLDESDAVDRTLMLIVRLDNLAGVSVVLYNLLVAVAGEEDIRARRVPDAAERSLLRAKRVDDSTGLRVPEVRHTIEPGREEAATIVLKGNVPHCSGVGVVLVQAPLAFDVPDAAAAVVASTQQQ